MGLFSGIGTAISGIAGALATSYAAKKSAQSVSETNAANLNLAKLQNDWNIDQWNRENEYNSPSNQLQLLKDAGLNPLFYGSSVGSGSQAGHLTSADMANQVPDTVSPGLYAQASNQFLQSQTQALQYMLQSRQLDQRDRELDIQERLAGYQGRNIAMQEQNSELNRKIWQQQVTNLEKEGRLTESKIKNLDQMTANAVTSQKEAEQRIANLAETLHGIETANQRADLAYKIEQATQNAQIRSAFLDLGVKQAQINKMNQEFKNFILDGERKKFEIDIAGVTASIKRTENAQLQYEVHLNKKYGDKDRQLEQQLKAAEIANQYINGTCKVIDTGMNAIKTSFDIAESASPLGIMKSIANPSFKVK